MAAAVVGGAKGADAPAGPAANEMATDVLVAGGGLGGVAGALAALRLGRKVILTEETAWLGGQATTQGVPLDEHPWIESYGGTRGYREFRTRVRELYRRTYPLTPEAWSDPTLNPGAGWVSALSFEPRSGLAALGDMLAPYQAKGSLVILRRHRPIAAAMEGDRCRAVTFQDLATGDRRVIAAGMVLDATELGELLPLAGVEHVVGAESRAETGEPNALEGAADPGDQMAFTHVFALDYRPGEEHVIDRPGKYEFWRSQKNARTGKPVLALNDLFAVEQDFFGQKPRPGHYNFSPWAFRRMLCRDNFAAGAFPSDVTVAIWGQNEYHHGVLLGVPEAEAQRHREAARQQSLSLIYWLQTEAPNLLENRTGFPGLRPRGDVFGTKDGLAPYPYIRESRRIRAEFTVLEQHFRTDLVATRHGPVKYPDSVGLSGYRIDIHKAAKSGQSMTLDNFGKHWRQQIPLGALLPVRVENLLPAAKNLGVTAVTNGAFRVHPTEWNIGEAAGALAAHCLNRGLAPRHVRAAPARLADFQRELAAQGFELDWPGLETAQSYHSHHYYLSPPGADWYYGEAKRLRRPTSVRPIS